MPKESSNRSKDYQGAGQLTVDAILGITDIVESMHHTITSIGGIIGQPGQTRTKGITGMIYKTVRTVTALAGKGLDVSLNHLGSLMEASESSPGREAVLSALNGVLGDYLIGSENPLTISMCFRREGIPLREEELSEIILQSNGKVVILIHGLCMNDLQWNRDGHDHGAALSCDLGITPIYLHYNTGRHISENGKEFANLLETFLTSSPQPIELFIVAHSMGGLVSRSACHYAKLSGHTWLKQLKKMVLLGTPHHGAPLEKGGNWLENILKISRYSLPFARLGKIRSAGILDLRYGNVVDEDWKGLNPHELSGDQRTPVPLPEEVLCYAFAGTISKEVSKLGDDLIGDGLVTVNSALGRHKNPQLQLVFPESHQRVEREINHLDLLNKLEVYEVLNQWLATEPIKLDKVYE